jgi:hypothetical protein
LTTLLGKKKVRKRRVGRRRKKGSKLYFNNDTQASIVAFQHNSENKKEQQKIYQLEIQSAFDKLVENLIFIHGFQGHHDSFEDLKSDCVTFLYRTLPKYKSERGTKAFSYFNIVAKNFLIIKNKHRITKVKRNVSLDDSDSMGLAEQEALRDYYTVPSPDDQIIGKEFNEEISGLLKEIKIRLKNDSEIRTIESIIYIFKYINQVDLLNKRAVFFYIREMTGLSAKQLTTNMAVIKRHYKELRGNDDFGIF